MDRKMIVVDLDGTLLNIRQECSNRTKKYLRKLKDLGYVIVIATGRVLGSAVDVCDGAEFANYIIANAGALIYDNDKKKVIMKNSISKVDMKAICDKFNDEIDYIDVCDLFYHNRCLGNDSIRSKYGKYVNNVDKFMNDIDNILHITVKFKDNYLVDKYLKIFDRDSLEVIVMQDSFTNRKWLEIFNNGVSKYNAIKMIMNIEGIYNGDVIAFGDGLNDIDMIENCGIGVAMENALSEVKNVSDYVTISHNNDGVIYFLKGYMRGNDLVS